MDDFTDEYDFIPSKGSNLASLFGNTTDSPEKKSLAYTAPKQPNQNKEPEAVKPQSSVLCAYIVTVWKMVDGKYIQLGTHGLAIVGTQLPNTQDLLLYKDKTNIILRLRLSKEFHWVVKPDNYATFLDAEMTNWLIKCRNQDDYNTLSNNIDKFGATVEKLQPEKKEENLAKVNEEKNISGSSSETQARTDILNRIAKMGQSILPNQAASTESLNELSCKIETTSAPSPVPSPRHMVYTPKPESALIAKEHHEVSTRGANVVSMIPNSQIVVNQTYDPLSIHFAETRTHNTEVRMNLSQISDKLNHILQVVENKPTSTSTSDENVYKNKIKVLHLQLDNMRKEISNYQKENAILKEDQKVNSLNEELLREKQERIIESEELKNRIKIDGVKMDGLTGIIEEQKQIIERLSTEKDSLIREQSLCTEEVSNLREQIESLKKQESDDKGVVSEHIKPPIPEDKTVEILKSAMNDTYNAIMSNFDDSIQYSSAQIRKIVGSTIKSSTLNVIKQLEQ